jgi:DNA primase
MDSQVDEIKAKVDIHSLVSQYVDLKKSGKNYKGLCPFHGEKTPSFMVNPERNIFKCFGCNEGGDVFTFLEKIEGVSFAEAIKILAKRAGVELTQIEISPEEKNKEIYKKINGLAADFYNYLLENHAVGREARDYLKSRGIEEKTIKEFKLGFAPRQPTALVEFLGKKGYNSGQLFSAGVALSGSRGLKDRFFQRILFPIFNLQGEVVGFSGRILGEGEPKYLNSPDSPIFNKSKLLFGLHLAKTEAKKSGEIVLVEGNFDVILSHQVGVKNVVAPLGTGFGESQIALIKRFTENLSICFDTDRAGQAATQRGIELSENAGLSVSVIRVSGGKDPAEVIVDRPSEWKKAVEKKTPVLDFYLDTFINRFGSDSAESKRKIGASYLPILGKIEDPLIRTHYLQKMAALLKLDEEVVLRSITRFLPGAVTTTQTSTVPENVSLKHQVEKYLLALILQSKILPRDLSKVEFRDATYSSIKKILDLQVKDKQTKIETEDVLSKLTETEKSVVNDMLLLDIGNEILLDEEKINAEIKSCINRLQEVNLRLSLRKLAIEVKQAEAAQDSARLTDLNKQFRDLSLKLNNSGEN